VNHKITIPANGNRLAIIKAFIVFLWKLPADKSFDVEVTKHKKRRTNLQNNSLHKFFELLGGTLNDAGLDMRELLKEEIAIEWTPSSVKEKLWKPIQKAMFNKESTADLETDEVSMIYEVLSKHLGEKRGIYVPFPSREM
jgi:hypothetical protein